MAAIPPDPGAQSDPGPVTFDTVMKAELEAIRKRRHQALHPDHRGPIGPAPIPMKSRQAESGTPDEQEKALRVRALDEHLAGLAISGGGIRSATFALGVIQALAGMKLLRRFDYLSTVSGGGYAGSWLVAWIKRTGGVLPVEQQLSVSRVDQRKSDRVAIGRGRIVDEEPEPVRHLRAFSNYLAPRVGALTADTWTLLAIYARNTLINALLLLPLTVAFVLLVRLLAACFVVEYKPDSWLPVSVLSVAVLALFGTFFGIGREIAKLYNARAASRSAGGVDKGFLSPKRVRPRSLWLLVVIPFLVAVILFIWLLAPNREKADAAEPSWHTMTVWRLPAYSQPQKAAPRLPSFAGGLDMLRVGIAWGEADKQPTIAKVNESDKREEFPWVTALRYALVFGILLAMGHGLGFICSFLQTIHRKPRSNWNWSLRNVLWAVFSIFVSGASGGFLVAVLVTQGLWKWYDMPVAVVSFGPPLGILIIVAAAFIEVWLLGRLQDEDIREWWSRVCALMMILALVWAALFATIFYVPALVAMFRDYWLGSGLAMGWLATSIAGAFAGRSPRTDNPHERGHSRWLDWIGAIAPVVFLLGLLATVAVLVSAMVDEPGGTNSPTGSAYLMAYWSGIHGASLKLMGIWLAAALFGVVLANWASDVNLFSLHAMYANRLTRCYLGASRPKMSWLLRSRPPQEDSREYREEFHGQDGFRQRLIELATMPGGVHPRPRTWLPGRGGAPTTVGSNPPLADPDVPPARIHNQDRICRPIDPNTIRQANLVTGFDPDDDIPLWALEVGVASEKGGAGNTTYWGPLHLINTSLNLVAGKELALQDRKAESFTLSSMYCGSKSTWYRRMTEATAPYLTLGRAMAISGAAADPNMGRHQSAPLTALMTIFNARLGWWMQNPRFDAWLGSGPKNARLLLDELLGLTDERHPYVHLSDGGHFENLAVYELIRRRCRYVVAVDGEQDRDMNFDGLATLIRQCRTDFGIRIEIDTAPLKPEGSDRLSRWHGVVGRIRYDDVDGGEVPGLLIYLKASVTGDEPIDVRNYRAANPDFPHQSTADQFFDEAQFESYRTLGSHVANEVFRDALDEMRDAEPLWPDAGAIGEFVRGNRRLFSAVERHWSGEAPGTDARFLESVRSWVKVQEDLRTEENLHGLSRDLYPELDDVARVGHDGRPEGDEPGNRLPELHAVAQMLQAMEDAWVNLKLGHEGSPPVSRGWLGVFRRWSSSVAFRRYWPTLKPEFSQDFVRFCESQLGLKVEPKVAWADEFEGRFAQESLDQLAGQIAREWPANPKLGRKEAIDLHRLLAMARSTWTDADVQRAGRLDVELRTPVWLILQAPVGEDPLKSPERFATGIVVGWRPDPAREPLTFRVFLWLRPAYRSIGIGSLAARQLFPSFLKMATAALQAPWAPEVLVQVEYPPAGEKRSESAEFALWRNFYSLYDFRPAPRHSEFEPDETVRIERRFGLHEFDQKGPD